MPKLKIRLALVIKSRGGEVVSPQEVFLNYLLTAVSSKYQDGVDGIFRRTFGRITAKFEGAIEKNLDTIDVEMAELDLIKNAFKDGKLPAIFSYNASLMEDAIEEAYKKIKE